MSGEVEHPNAVDIYGRELKILLADLADGADHATCPECRDAMLRARSKLIEFQLRGGRRNGEHR